MFINKKNVLNLVFLLVVFTFTVYYVFHDQNMEELLSYIKQADVMYWLLGVVAIVAFILSESVIIYYMMHSVQQRPKLLHCFLYSFVGFFFSCITPSATGGQPAQIYFMKKDKLSIPISTLILMIVTITYKMVLVVIGVLVVVIRPASIMQYLQPVMGWCYLGVFLNVICIIMMMTLVFHPSLAKNILLWGLGFLNRIVHLKKMQVYQEKIQNSMKKYQEVALYFGTHKRVIVNVFGITFIQRCIWFAVTYLVYRSFALSGAGVFTITTLQGMISVAVDMLPLPGGMGMSEHLFRQIFIPLCGIDLVNPVMIVSRGISYYAELIISAILTVVAYFVIVQKSERKK